MIGYQLCPCSINMVVKHKTSFQCYCVQRVMPSVKFNLLKILFQMFCTDDGQVLANVICGGLLTGCWEYSPWQFCPTV